MTDIFHKIAARDSASVARKYRTVTRYRVMYTRADGYRGPSRKTYTKTLATKLAARLNRRPYADAYASAVTVTIATPVLGDSK